MSSTTVRRSLGLAAIAGAAVVMLSGCITVKADLTVSPDATASGTFSLELQKEAAGFLGITSAEAFSEGISSGDVTGDTGLGSFTDCTPSESDTGYVYSCTFTDMEFTDPEGPWTISKEGDVITFTMTSTGADTGTGEEADLLGDASLGSIEVNVVFPGAITSATGTGVEQTSDTAATITGSLTDSISATITSEAGGGFSISSLLVILIFAAIVILIIVVVVVLITRRRKTTPELEPATIAAAEAIEVAPEAQALSAEELTALEAPVEPDVTEDTVVVDEVVDVVDVDEVVEEAADDTVVVDEVVAVEEIDEVADVVTETVADGTEPEEPKPTQ